MRSAPIHLVGGGLAGCEAAWQIARAGGRAVLHEMRPTRGTEAHKTDRLAELVCSNSLKSEQENTAPWLLKEELRRLGSLLIGTIAPRARVPGGHALTVDREIFAAEVGRAMEADPAIEIRREEITSLDIQDDGSNATFIVASGPLTSNALAQEIARITGAERLYFHDSISPIVDAESIDTSIAFRASRYGKSLDGTDDYLNCPFDRAQYEAFLDALLAAESVPAHIEEDRSLHAQAADGAAGGETKRARYFEACLPIEEIARRGRDTLRFGPMKPMGLTDPRTGRRPYAVVQLRQENVRAGSYNLVGFQNHMRFGEQQRVLRMIPGLERAEFLRYGQVHRNTYINGPALLTATLQLRARSNIFFAGQISGVEGYVESIATGLVAGRAAAALAAGETPLAFPRQTAVGSLCAYVTGADPENYQPANITFDLLPKLENPPRDKRIRQAEVCRRALTALDAYLCAPVPR
ncbi:MAG TPA: methylenetetrahydrofolate--tRNA-(uracil(54)-C(5))-methyltransferase (FADH(2)-oxidizing) TrmFO [Bryobacteraceae bacterium]|nr:methylenetetrahydrofolate--tRNA-(uracil(54)-C(5))-methyltransferase (FADH(2)-oxidizing) TrmFO [Bryobacteraceae bacterium]